MKYVKAYAVCLLVAVFLVGCAGLQGRPISAPTGPLDVLGYSYAGIDEIAVAVEDLRATCEVSRSVTPGAQCLVDDEKAAKVKVGLDDALARPDRAREVMALFNVTQLESEGVPPQVAKLQGVLAVVSMLLEAAQ